MQCARRLQSSPPSRGALAGAAVSGAAMATTPAPVAAVLMAEKEEEAANDLPWYGVAAVGGSGAPPSSQAAFPAGAAA